MRTRINSQSTWKSRIILVMDDTYTYSSLVAKVLFSLLNTGVYRHSTLIVPKKEKLCMRLIKDGKKKQKSSI